MNEAPLGALSPKNSFDPLASDTAGEAGSRLITDDEASLVGQEFLALVQGEARISPELPEQASDVAREALANAPGQRLGQTHANPIPDIEFVADNSYAEPDTVPLGIIDREIGPAAKERAAVTVEQEHSLALRSAVTFAPGLAASQPNGKAPFENGRITVEASSRAAAELPSSESLAVDLDAPPANGEREFVEELPQGLDADPLETNQKLPALENKSTQAAGPDIEKLPAQTLEMAFNRNEITPSADKEIARIPAHFQVADRPDPTQHFELRQIVRGSEGRLELRLDPPELGRVTIEFASKAGEMVRAIVTADASDTLDLMRRNSEALLEELARNGIIGLSLDFRGGASNPRNDSAAENLAGEGVEDTDAAMENSPPRYIAQGGGLDIHL